MSRERPGYTPTEATYAGGAEELYLTYLLEQETRSGGTATYPKVQRVYLPGELVDWTLGRFEKRSGREVHGVRVRYTTQRSGYTAERGDTLVDVPPTTQRVARIVEVPEAAREVQLRTELPGKYRKALQDVS